MKNRKVTNRSAKGFEPMTLTRKEEKALSYFDSKVIRTHIDDEELSDSELNSLVRKDLLSISGNCYLLTPKGMRWLHRLENSSSDQPQEQD